MCAFDDCHMRHFVLHCDAPVEATPWGWSTWICRPGLVNTQQILVVQVEMPPGGAHPFHQHPGREEVLWIIEGTGEQWVDRKKMLLGPGDSAFIPADTVHGIYNDSGKPLRFLAVLSPAETSGPMLVDVQYEEPWASLRSPRSLK